MKRTTRSSSRAESNARPHPPLPALVSPFLSTAFILSALMQLLEPEDKRSLRLACRALRQAIDPQLDSFAVPEHLNPVEARAARARWPSVRNISAFSLKELALLADGGELGPAFPQLASLALHLPSCSNRQLVSITRYVRSCPLLTCLKLNLLQPGCLPALAPLFGCMTLRSLHLSLTGHEEQGTEQDWQTWHPTGLQALSSITQLQDVHLHIAHDPGTRELFEALALEGLFDGLAALRELEVGEMFTLDTGSFAALAGCSRLQRLSWSACIDDAVHHLHAASPHLQRLDLHHCEGLRSLTGLERLTSLQRLSLTDCFHLLRGDFCGDVLSPLSALAKLTDLALSGTCNILSIGCLSGLTRLTSLDISGTDVSSLEVLCNLTALLHFDASCCWSIEDFSPLRCCSRLQHLGLQSHQNPGVGRLFATADGEPPLALQHLSFLDITNTQVLDLAALSTLTGLQELHLAAVKVSQPPTGCSEDGGNARIAPEPEPAGLDISPLPCLTGLTMLDLSFCSLRSPPGFTPLLGLSRLQLLRCEELEPEARACLSSLVHLELAGFDNENQD